jgi:hypothetical protein
MAIRWDEENIFRFIIDEIEENLNLDYKAADALGKTDGKKNEISKDISAMANSDGGIIIYGIAEYNDSNRSHLPEKIDPVSRKNISKEWLEQIINTNIFPRISNIKITPVGINNSDDGVIYVVDIPKSNTAHQAKDKRYYKRFNFESVAMYDYEIKDIMNRAHTPILTLEFLIEQESYEYKKSGYSLGIPMYNKEVTKPESVVNTELVVNAYNEGKILANYINCYIDLPESILLQDEIDNKRKKEIDGILYVEKYCDNQTREIVGFTHVSQISIPNYGTSHYDPVLPKTKHKLIRIKLNNEIDYGDMKIFWMVYADNAEPINGDCLLKDMKIVISNRESI